MLRKLRGPSSDSWPTQLVVEPKSPRVSWCSGPKAPGIPGPKAGAQGPLRIIPSGARDLKAALGCPADHLVPGSNYRGLHEKCVPWLLYHLFGPLINFIFKCWGSYLFQNQIIYCLLRAGVIRQGLRCWSCILWSWIDFTSTTDGPLNTMKGNSWVEPGRAPVYLRVFYFFKG